MIDDQDNRYDPYKVKDHGKNDSHVPRPARGISHLLCRLDRDRGDTDNVERRFWQLRFLVPGLLGPRGFANAVRGF